MATNEPNTEVPVVRRTRLLGFFANHPVLGALGSLASIISISLAFWFFWQARRYPDLVYFVNPAKAVVVKTGETSSLKVSFNDSDITTDVTAAQIAIWNQGNQGTKRVRTIYCRRVPRAPPVLCLPNRGGQWLDSSTDATSGFPPPRE